MATKKTYRVTGEPAFPPTHPGRVLRTDVLPALNVSVSQAARDMGVTRQALHRILAEHAAVSPEMALRLGRFCGNGPQLWLGLQQAWDLHQAAQALGDTLLAIPQHAGA